MSNEIGNQLFMYASAYGIAKKLNRTLLIDDETAYTSKKNISRYALSNFKISSKITFNKYKFLGLFGYIKRKLLKKINIFLKKKKFFIEIKNKKKITKFNNEIFEQDFSNFFYLEGYFETEKYFKEYENEIRNEFKFIDEHKFQKSSYYNKIVNQNSTSICIRQNRFSEGLDKDGNENKSNQFSHEQIKYINKSILHIKEKVKNPVFYMWSNDFSNLEDNLFNEKINRVIHDDIFISNIDKRSLDLYLISKAKNHIVIPSSFNWWGAWLSKKENKIIMRPSNSFFSEFKLNNRDFWPKDWIVINE